MQRNCDVCGSDEQTELHRQWFEVVGLGPALSYRVVVCDSCGFVFASDVPDQVALEAYYQNNAKHAHGATLPAGLQRIHDDFYSFLDKSLWGDVNRSRYRVVEVGCSSGHFLNRLRGAGFENLTGVEPSETGARQARELFGLDVHNLPLGAFESAQPFDAVVMSGVLEHIAELDKTVRSISRLLREGGHVCWLVPDAARFHEITIEEPHFEFALEHINFFSRSSLSRLAARFGLAEQVVTSRHNDFYNNYNLMAVYEKVSVPVPALPEDTVTQRRVREYAEASKQRLAAIDALLAPHLADGGPVAVWGTGMLTSRLLTDSALKNATIAHFVDSNRQLHGKQLRGVTIESPDVLRGKRCPVVVASLVYQQEIHATLTQQFGYQGPVITLGQASQ